MPRPPKPLIAPGTPDWSALQRELDGLLTTLDLQAHRRDDPVDLVWAYPHPDDREVVGLIAATLAYGRVALLKRAIQQALAPLGPRPAARLRALPLDPDATPTPLVAPDFVYRMTRGDDLNALYRAIGAALRAHGSLQALFLHHDPPAPGGDYRAALTGFVHALRAWGRSDRRGFRYLLADPASGGACKRLNLYLRWMIRGPDTVDLGLWADACDPARLVMPLDTHIVRIARYLGLGTSSTTSWKLARQVADNLKRLDPKDPTRYDFALCHMGISGACPAKRVASICAQCPIQRVCRLE